MSARRRWDIPGLGPVAARLLLALLAIDGLFVVLHATHVRYDAPGSGLWLLSRDRGFPELFQYAKEAAIVALLGSLAVGGRSLIYGAWAALVVYLLLDDSLEIHETGGDAIAEGLGLGSVAGIEAKDLGQIGVSAVAGLVLLTLIATAHRRDRSMQARELSWRLLVAIGLLAFFGIATDVIDAIDLFGIVEDGGEMVVVSAIVALVVDHRIRVAGSTRAGSQNFFPEPVE